MSIAQPNFKVATQWVVQSGPNPVAATGDPRKLPAIINATKNPRVVFNGERIDDIESLMAVLQA